MRSTTSAVGLILVLTASACVSTPNGDAQDLAGCYYFEQDATAQRLGMPWGVQLTADSLTDWAPLDQQPDTYFAVTLLGPERTRDFPFGYWQKRGADSVRIGYPSLGAWSLDLAWEEGRLVGTAQEVGDAGLAERRSYPVQLQHARCPE